MKLKKSYLFFLVMAISAYNNLEAQSKKEEAIKNAVLNFIDGINTLDADKIMNSYSDGATVFYPFSFTPELLKGKVIVKEKQLEGFMMMRKLFDEKGLPAPTTLNLEPKDFVITMLTRKVAIVNWHSPRPKHVGRRTAVLQKIKGQWLIISHHASNISI